MWELVAMFNSLNDNIALCLNDPVEIVWHCVTCVKEVLKAVETYCKPSSDPRRIVNVIVLLF